MKIKSIRDVAEYQLCCGCGVCAFMAPENIQMVNDFNQGMRPLVNEDEKSEVNEAFEVCPGKGLINANANSTSEIKINLLDEWGPILKIKEGFSTSDDIRFKGSSGGVASALALYGIEKNKVYGILHTVADDNIPYINKTALSTTKQDILKSTGSRYSPASPCDSLQKIVDAPGQCIFIGKPCDVAAVKAACTFRPELDKKIALTISIFCAGTPTTNATLKLLDKFGVDKESSLSELRYRGNGWPGMTTVKFISNDNKNIIKDMTYAEAWGDLANDKQWRCNLCPDHTGEFADISVGDPWYQEISESEPGRSMLLIRTNRGLSYVDDSEKSGYLILEEIEDNCLPASQPNLLKTRGAVWGRIFTLRLLSMPNPNLNGFVMFKIWRKTLSFKQKAQSFLGTIKRVFKRKLWLKHPVLKNGIE